MIGCSNTSAGGRLEIDVLTGGADNDIFWLGSTKTRFYDDGSANSAGSSDYALITDFSVGLDKLQLMGSKERYFLAASGVTGVAGRGLFYDSNANSQLEATDELIAIIRSATLTSLTAANTIHTAIFV